MSVLTLVRHGQAQFFADDYDQLSAVGEQQSVLLGQHWVRQGLTYDAVYTGPRVRQRRSADFAGAAYRQAGLAWPDPIVLEDLDEYDLDGLIHHFAPELARENAEFARRVALYRQSQEPIDRLRNFQRMFESLLRHWQAAETCTGVESWPDFRQRIQRVIRQMQASPGRSRRMVLFTSGGFISGMAQWALAAPDESALKMNWRIRNGSLTEFLVTSDRFTLDSFNTVPHLHDPALWTYR